MAASGDVAYCIEIATEPLGGLQNFYDSNLMRNEQIKAVSSVTFHHQTNASKIDALSVILRAKLLSM